jgi:hypothetical protein
MYWNFVAIVGVIKNQSVSPDSSNNPSRVRKIVLSNTHTLFARLIHTILSLTLRNSLAVRKRGGPTPAFVFPSTNQ